MRFSAFLLASLALAASPYPTSDPAKLAKESDPKDKGGDGGEAETVVWHAAKEKDALITKLNKITKHLIAECKHPAKPKKEKGAKKDDDNLEDEVLELHAEGNVKVTNITAAKEHSAGRYAILDLAVTMEINGDEKEVGVEVKTLPTDRACKKLGCIFVINGFQPIDWLPKCVRERIAQDEKKAKENTECANKEECAAMKRELNNEEGEEAGDVPGHFDKSQTHLSGVTKGMSVYHERNHFVTDKYAKVAGEEFHFGDKSVYTEADFTYAIPKENEVVFASSLPDAYSPFVGTDCLTQQPPRDQGSCGACYAFAASTTMSLQYCHARASNGRSTKKMPLLTAQGLVSCGKQRGNWQVEGGCGGGDSREVASYMTKFGITTTACWPYAEGGGNPKDHFNSAGRQIAACRTDCVPKYQADHPNTPMTFINYAKVKGKPQPLTFNTEANIAAAMARYGALACSYTIYSSFMNDFKPERGAVYMGRTNKRDAKTGGHAVSCYGFGTDSDGTKYWQCINSWKNWGMAPRGEFRILRKPGRQSESSGLITACTVAAIDYNDVFPDNAPDPPTRYCADMVGPTGLLVGDKNLNCNQVEKKGFCKYNLGKQKCPIRCKATDCTSTVSFGGGNDGPPAPGPVPPRDKIGNCTELLAAGHSSNTCCLSGGGKIKDSCKFTCRKGATPPAKPPAKPAGAVDQYSNCEELAGPDQCGCGGTVSGGQTIKDACAKSCEGAKPCAMDKYNNCADLAGPDLSGCDYTLTTGEKIKDACAKSCENSSEEAASEEAEAVTQEEEKDHAALASNAIQPEALPEALPEAEAMPLPVGVMDK